MAVHTIKGLTCSVKVDIPPYLDEKTKKVLLTVLKYCLEPGNRKKVMASMNNLLSHVSILMDWLRKSNQYEAEVEKAVRDFVGLHLNHGFLVGQSYAEADDSESSQGSDGDDEEEDDAPSVGLEKILSEQMDYQPVLERIDSAKKTTAVVLFYAMDLARLAFETGLLLSHYLSEDMVEKHYKKLQKETGYIG